LGEQSERAGIGVTCGTSGGEEECVQDFGGGREVNIELDFKETELKGIDRIYVAQDRQNWWALLHTIINRIP
jgi:hypothetical protein